MDAISVSEARATLSKIIDRVESGDEIVLTRRGRRVAVIVSPDVLRHARTAQALEAARRLRRQLEEDRRQPLSERGLSLGSTEALIAEIREGRDSR
jgi:prevent-host-death family protein